MPHLRHPRGAVAAALVVPLLALPALAGPASAVTPTAAPRTDLVYTELRQVPGTTTVVSSIVVSAPDGSDPTTVLSVPAEDGQLGDPELSPDRSHVVFTRTVLPDGPVVPGEPTPFELDISVVDINGTNARDLTDDGLAAEPTWAGNGSVVFTRLTSAGTTGLRRVDLTGGAPVDLGHEGSGPDVRSGQLVFTGPTGDLGVTSLAPGAAVRDLGVRGTSASWSPDGTEIAYTQVQASDQLGGLHVVQADSSDDRALPAADAGGSYNVLYPTWLPDGESLVYTALPKVISSGTTTPQYGLFTVDRLGTRAGALFPAEPGVVRFTGQARGDAPADVTGATTPARFVPLTPARVFDSREAQDAPGPKGQVGAGETVDVSLAGAVPAGATAVVLNVTAVGATEPTYVTVLPTGSAVPSASTLNPPARTNVANLTTVRLGADRSVTLYNSAGRVDLVADLSGYYVPGSGDGFSPAGPRRAYDSRPGTAAPGVKARLGAGSTVDVPVTGPTTGVPFDATAVVVTLTGIDATDGTLLRAYPTPAAGDGGVPVVSNLNLAPHRNAANLAVVKVGEDGRVRLRNDRGTLDVALDVTGYYRQGAPGAYVAVDPVRFLDTRTGLGAVALPLGPGQGVDLHVAGVRGIPAGATAVVGNLTGVSPSTQTVLRAFPSGAVTPEVSNLNLVPGEVRANAAYLLPDLASGRTRLLNGSGLVDLLTDVSGYFVATPLQ